MAPETLVDTMEYFACSLLLTLIGLFAVVTLSTAQVRDVARMTLLSFLRVSASAFGFILIGIIYVPILLLDRADENFIQPRFAGNISSTLGQRRVRHRRHNNSDVSELELGSPFISPKPPLRGGSSCALDASDLC
ncbi:hypothetical protein JX265_000591 [Neoarthrinium moseri]|uniref:Uncharacterized protein n=1 Tax=Neoarthrinium moseri TaxID=1658444 RepID=A0A9P9WYT0_9PEZI|nr:uncharacterized protein JN550_001655 [Neoarthrinium moseri]KAI1854187.1 hypothetical protein JX266_001328 [Neoarthrinium moseri]KAI1876159.1 hypothetical protein JN550_001655 [Neoarthrinium moseri]KAI1881765.1 hypothetical protein JX265_000591 [Neoarthrinium moseri]